MYILVLLKFTPLEFETRYIPKLGYNFIALKFTPLEFETSSNIAIGSTNSVKIYSVGV